MIKTRLVRLRGAGIGAARAHLRYIQRDGVQRDGSPGMLYSSDDIQPVASEFVERCASDRHQFRIIVSPEDGDQYDDLKPLVRRFMAQMERDLGTKLEWVAADHVDTGHPHAHVILRGKDERGGNLMIAREYISKGMRERLSDILTQDLGPRQDHEIRRRMRLEVSDERMTSIDRSFETEAGQDRIVGCSHRDPFRHALRAARLRKLEALGLAEPVGGARWKLAPDLRQQLTALGERGDIIRTMQRALTASDIERGAGDRVIDREIPEPGLVGRLLERGLADELTGRQYAIIDALDGRVHRIDLGSDRSEAIAHQAIIRVSPGQGWNADGRGGAVGIELLSPLPLNELANREASTFLDEQLAADQPFPCRDAGFGSEFKSALAVRRRWLLDRGLAEGESGFAIRPGTLALLRQREIAGATARLSKELGLGFAPVSVGDPVHGLLSRRVDLACGRFALIESGRHFSLVPWKSVLESHLGRTIEGVARRGDVSWTLGRTRSLEL